MSERFRAGQNPTKWTKWKDPPVHSFAFTFGTAILGIVEEPHLDLPPLEQGNYDDSLLNHRIHRRHCRSTRQNKQTPRASHLATVVSPRPLTIADPAGLFAASG